MLLLGTGQHHVQDFAQEREILGWQAAPQLGRIRRGSTSRGLLLLPGPVAKLSVEAVDEGDQRVYRQETLPARQVESLQLLAESVEQCQPVQLQLRQTSLGAALNDTAQEVGTSIGVAVTGSVLAAVLGAAGIGGWSPATISAYYTGEQTAFVLLALLAGAASLYGASTLTESRNNQEH